MRSGADQVMKTKMVLGVWAAGSTGDDAGLLLVLKFKMKGLGPCRYLLS